MRLRRRGVGRDRDVFRAAGHPRCQRAPHRPEGSVDACFVLDVSRRRRTRSDGGAPLQLDLPAGSEELGASGLGPKGLVANRGGAGGSVRDVAMAFGLVTSDAARTYENGSDMVDDRDIEN